MRTVFIGIRRIAIEKKSAPKIFDGQSMPSPWAWSSLGLGPILQANNFYKNQQNCHQKNLPRKFLIANPCRCHGHGHRSGLGRACKRTVFYRGPQNRHPKKSVPKIFDSQSMPPPWAWSSFGFGPILQPIDFYRNQQNRHPKFFGPKIFGGQSIPPPCEALTLGVAPLWYAQRSAPECPQIYSECPRTF